MEPNRGPPPPPPPPPPPAPPLVTSSTNTLNAIRQTYMNLFNQILDNSININCICKTTTIRHESAASAPKCSKKFKLTNPHTVFDSNNFLSDDDDDEPTQNQATTRDLGSAFAYSNELGKFLRDADYDESGLNQNLCDLSCFEKMRLVHTKLKEAAAATNDASNFDRVWSTFKFLAKCPSSCDYYGTTIFHYAATDERPELLERCLRLFPNGVKCIDSKGMTPLMRAVQRNNMACVRFLLNNTNADLNGSAQSTYTPLWFAVSNGYDELALLLLNYNASSSMVEKSISSPGGILPVSVTESLLRPEELSGGTSVASASYLFSPLRASIVYARFHIMAYLLEFNAGVYELFSVGRVGSNRSRLTPPGPTFNPKLNEDYLNSLKFFHRQFGLDEHTALSSSVSRVDLEAQLNILNEFIDDVNVYRRMLIEFVKNLVHRLNSNLSLVDRLYDYLNSQSKANTIDFIVKMNECVSSSNEREPGTIEKVDWCDYLTAVREFIDSLEKFLSLTPENSFTFNLHSNNSLIRKPNYNRSLFDFAVRLVNKYHAPKTLKQLVRFKLREMLFDKVERPSTRVKYCEGFLKRDHLESIVRQLGLPNGLCHYLLFKS